MADADVAAYGGKQSARAFRAHVRFERQHRPSGARGAAQPGQEPSRFRERARESTATPTRGGRQSQNERLSGVAPRCGEANSKGGRTEFQRVARRGAARRYSGQVRGPGEVVVRLATAGLPIRPDAGDHIYVRSRADGPALSTDWSARGAPSNHAPPGQPGKDGEMRQNSALSHRAVY